MCLPFCDCCCCCRENDAPSHGANDRPGDGGVSQTQSTGTGKGASNGNGAIMNKSDEDKKTVGSSPAKEVPENWGDQKSKESQAREYSNKQEERFPSSTPAAPPQAPRSPSPEHMSQKIKEDYSVAAKTPTAATKAAKKLDQVTSPCHHAGSVAAAGVADYSARMTPPETQIARRGHANEDDYGYRSASGSPTGLAAVPAADNFHGDRGHGDAHHAHAHVGKDDRRKTPGSRAWQ